MKIIETVTIEATLTELIQWDYNTSEWTTTQTYDSEISDKSWNEPVTLIVTKLDNNDPLALAQLIYVFCQATGRGKLIVNGSHTAEFQQCGVNYPMP